MFTHNAETAEGGSGASQRSDPLHARNKKLHLVWSAAKEELAKAQEGGDKLAIKRAQRRTDEAAGDFVEANLKLAYNAAKSFNRGEAANDYVAAAFEGLWEAAKKWDPSKNITFGTFSHTYIKGKVQRAVRAGEYSHISQTDFNRRQEVIAAREKLSRELGRAPSIEEISADTQLTLGLVERALQPRAASLDSPVGDGETTLGDLFDNDTAPVALNDEELAMLEGLLTELSEAELWVLVQRNGLAGGPPQSLVEVEDTIGMGREIVRRTEKRAREKVAELAHSRGVSLKI